MMSARGRSRTGRYVLRMPERFAVMPEKETEYGGGTGWAVAGWVFTSLGLFSGIGAGVTYYLYRGSGSYGMKKACIVCGIVCIASFAVGITCFSIGKCVARSEKPDDFNVIDENAQPRNSSSEYNISVSDASSDNK